MAAAAPVPTLTATDTAFHVEAYEKIDYSLRYVDGVFSPENPELAETYRPYGRCLVVIDRAVLDLYGDAMRAYFDHHGIALTVFPLVIREPDKTLRTVERIIDAFGDFGLVRTEPVLVVGGGLITDVTGTACSMFRRATNYIRIPTTLIGLDRRQCRDQGRGEPRQEQEPTRRVPPLAAGHPRFLVPEDPAGRPGAQRDGRAREDRDGREQRHLRDAREVRRGSAGARDSVTSTVPRNCATSRTG